MIPVVVLSVLRRGNSVRGAADRLGVTEAQIREWIDVFVVAGVLALKGYRLERTGGGDLRRSTPPGRRYYSTTPAGDLAAKKRRSKK
jgi:hypothetical protein